MINNCTIEILEPLCCSYLPEVKICFHRQEIAPGPLNTAMRSIETLDAIYRFHRCLVTQEYLDRILPFLGKNGIFFAIKMVVGCFSKQINCAMKVC